MKPVSLFKKRMPWLHSLVRQPLLAQLSMTLRSELQSTRDLLNFDPASPLAGMYRDERKATLIQAGAGLVTAAASVVYPPLVLASPATLYGGYKAADLFRPAAFAFGAALGLAGALYLKQPEVLPEPSLMPPIPSAPTKPDRLTGTALASASLHRVHI